MFTHDCPACGRRELIFPEQLTGIDNGPEASSSTSPAGAAAPRATSRSASSAPPDRADSPLSPRRRYASAVALGRRAALAQSVERITRND